MKKFKIRASKGGTLLTNGRAKDSMGETAKSYIKEWVISQLTGKEKKVTSKYFERGHALEDDAGKRVSKHYGIYLTKNEEHLENEYFTGTFDFKIENERVIDTKVPFDCFTFPYFVFEVDPDYYTQLQIYMNLTGLRKASLCFCLENGSEEQVERLSWKISKEKGKEEPDIEDWEQAEAELSYDHLPEKSRIKVFEFEYDEAFIEKLQNRVIEAREYIENELLTKINI